MSRPLPSHRYRTRRSNNRISEAVVAIGALTLGRRFFWYVETNGPERDRAR